MRVRLRRRRLRELLARSGRSQNAWATRVGVSRGHWSDLVNGKHPYPSAKTRRQIVEAFAVEVDDLFVVETAAPTEPDPAARASLSDRYVFDRLVGEGAMGAVYLARESRFGRQVAIKMLTSEALGGLGAESFATEVRRTARLQHPHILPLLDAGGPEDAPYHVTPYVEQGSLRDELEREGRLPIDRAVTILRGIAAALDHAHDHDVLHCDVKPENILLAGDHAYVADFGLARAVHLQALREWERPPEIDIGAGTPAYVSPEQARARLDLDRRSDVYSLACVAWEMLAGRAPFGGGRTTEIVKRRFDAVPPDLRAAAPAVPREVADVITAAMARAADRRPPTAGHFVRRLEIAAAAARGARSETRATAGLALSAVASWAATRNPRPRGDFMRNVYEDLRFSLRSLRHRPLFAIAAITTLALGIGANAAIFSVVNAVVLRPLPFPESERLLRVYSTFEGRRCCPLSTPNYLDLQAAADQVESMAAYNDGVFALTGGDEPVRARGRQITGAFFDLLGVEPQIGRLIRDEDDRFGAEAVVVLSDRLWRDRYGADDAILGETIVVDSIPRTIIGVTPPDFSLGRETALHLPFAWDPDNLPTRGRNWVFTLARIGPAASGASVLAELKTLYAGLVDAYPDLITNDGVDVLPLGEAMVGAGQRRPLLVLWGAVVMVLLVACANVVNLMLARAETRQRELAVRAALGASRGAIVRHFVVESMGIALAGGLLGLVAAAAGIRLLMSEFGGSIPRSERVSVDAPVLIFGLTVAVLTGLLVGLVPAVRLRAGHLTGMLSEGGRGASSSASGLRRGLVVFEVAVALILVVGAGLMLKSFWRLQRVDVGVQADRLLTARVSLPDTAYPESADVAAFWESLRDRIRQGPGIERVGMASAVPFSNTYNNFSRILPHDEPDRVATFVESRSVDPGFFDALGLPLREGRMFRAEDLPDNPTVVIINAELARQLFDGSPIGRTITWNPERSGFEVIGVVENVFEHGPDRSPPPTMYFSVSQGWPATMSVVIRSGGDPAAAVPFVRSTVTSLDPDLPVFAIRRFDRLIADGLGERRFSMSLLATFAALALSLGAIGVYGVMAYSVEGRTREIGIRQALGASRSSVLGMVVGQGGRMTGVGIAFGVFGAYLMRETITGLLFEVAGFDLAVVAGVVLLLGLVSVVACYVPAIRAAAVSPVDALREG